MSKPFSLFEPLFKQKAVELSYARGHVREVVEELGIEAELIYRWRREFKRYK